MLYLHLLKEEFINILLIKSKVNMNLVVAYYSAPVLDHLAYSTV